MGLLKLIDGLLGLDGKKFEECFSYHVFLLDQDRTKSGKVMFSDDTNKDRYDLFSKEPLAVGNTLTHNFPTIGETHDYVVKHIHHKPRLGEENPSRGWVFLKQINSDEHPFLNQLYLAEMMERAKHIAEARIGYNS